MLVGGIKGINEMSKIPENKRCKAHTMKEFKRRIQRKTTDSFRDVLPERLYFIKRVHILIFSGFLHDGVSDDC